MDGGRQARAARSEFLRVRLHALAARGGCWRGRHSVQNGRGRGSGAKRSMANKGLAEMASATPAGVWVKASQALRGELGDDTFGSWLAQACLRMAPGGELCLVTPTGIARDWIRRYAWRRIGELWALYDPEGRVLTLKSRLEFEAEGGAAPPRRHRSRRAPIRCPPTARPRADRLRPPDAHPVAAGALHLRQLRAGPVERVRPGGGAPGGVLGRRPLQPGRLPRRLRLRQDPPAERHRLGGHAHGAGQARWST